MIAAVETIWHGSAKDYEVIQQIFVQLKKEVAEATLRTHVDFKPTSIDGARSLLLFYMRTTGNALMVGSYVP